MNAQIISTNGLLTQREIIRRVAQNAKQTTDGQLVCNKKYLARRVGTDLIHLEKTVRFMGTYQGLKVELEANNFIFLA